MTDEVELHSAGEFLGEIAASAERMDHALDFKRHITRERPVLLVGPGER